MVSLGLIVVSFGILLLVAQRGKEIDVTTLSLLSFLSYQRTSFTDN